MTGLHLPPLDEFPKLRHLLERALAHFQSDTRVAGLIVGGSIAKGGVDSYPDVDLYMVVHDEDFDAVFAERDKAAAGMTLFLELRATLFDRYGLTVDPVLEQAPRSELEKRWIMRANQRRKQ